MKVLVACEESQEVCKAFRALGHEAYSCDILPCSGGHPEWHIQHGVFDYRIDDVGLIKPTIGLNWDLLIAHPPCTDLAVSGARWFKEKRADGRQQKAIDFFMQIANAPIPRICIENPVGIMSTLYREPDQYIQPYEYGHPETKKTCLWLKNLPKLIPTNNVYDEMMALPKSQRNRVHYMSPGPERAALRAKTYPGWASAMATQWGGDLK